MIDIRQADLPGDVPAIADLWLEYLAWGSNELHARHGFRMPVEAAVQAGLAHIGKFSPPDGCLLLARWQAVPVGVGCLQRIGPETAEVKRMYVRPAHRRGGLGRAMLDRLIGAAMAAGYRTVRLDSADFLAAAHAMYRSHGFVDIEAYPESEIPAEYRPYWRFMEKTLR